MLEVLSTYGKPGHFSGHNSPLVSTVAGHLTSAQCKCLAFTAHVLPTGGMGVHEQRHCQGR